MAAASECWSYDEKHGEAMIQIECSYPIHLHIYIFRFIKDGIIEASAI